MTHHVPTPLRDLDHAIRTAVANEPDDTTLTWAYLVLLTEPAAHPKPVERRPIPRLAAAAAVLLLIASLAVPVGLLARRSDANLSESSPPALTRPLAWIRPAPLIIELDDHGTSVRLRWTDPTNGRATFVVTQRPRDIPQVAHPGSTQITIQDLDPAVAQYCFTVIALLDVDTRSVSPERCTPTRR